MRKLLTITFLFFCTLNVIGENSDSIQNVPRHKKLIQKLYNSIKEFSRIDTNYIEPQHYNYTVMLQNTFTFENYKVAAKDGPSLTLKHEPSTKIGPYVGWRWIFLGYTIDVNHLGADKNKKEFDISLYSSQIGVDLFWRKTGSNYRISSSYIGDGVDTSPLIDSHFTGFNSSLKGFNLYYIFNHKKFSYPAAFSQSTIQRISCGSPLLGIGYTRHTINMDWIKFRDLVSEKMGSIYAQNYIDSSLVNSKIKFTDISLSGGYAYNYVFAHNFLFAASISIGLSYKNSVGDMQHEKWSIRDFSFKNFNIDGIGRFGLVWNNARWYAGTSAIMHTYNYHKDQFSTNSLFGNINIYVGFNFGKR